MKKTLTIFCLLFSQFVGMSQTLSNDSLAKALFKEDVGGRIKFELDRMKDAKTGKIASDEIEKARVQVKQNLRLKAAIPNVNWVERGPNNVGGRTRAIMFDPNDPQKKKVWAGGISGGLWYNNDITSPTSSWIKINDLWENLAVSCITYDPSNTLVMYVGTGELTGNIGGGGIWKTSNGGISWQRLNKTIPGTLPFWNINNPYVAKIAVNSQGHVYAATDSGLMLSKDGGTSWTKVTDKEYLYDVEIGSDDIVYFSNYQNIYKSKDGNGLEFTEISPKAIGLRKEIAIAKNTSGENQVIYAIAIKNNSTPVDVLYIAKSINGGKTWTELPIPSYVTGENFTAVQSTAGQGYYNLTLEVHPSNPNILVIGGTNLTRTTDGGNTWDLPLDYWRIHPDQHAIAFRPNQPNEVLIGNDGGIYYSNNLGDANATRLNFELRNTNYNVTQFYSVAMRNIPGDGYVIGGTQDNGTQRITSTMSSTGSAKMINGGDGGFCFIDQDNPNIQLSSTQYNNYYLHDLSGNYITKLNTGTNQGSFINPADYDSQNNTLYVNNGISVENSNWYTLIGRVQNVGTTNTFDNIKIPYLGIIECIKVCKTTPNAIYISTYSQLIKVSNLNTNSPTVNSYNYIGQMTGSSIAIGSSDSTLLITSSSTGIGNKNILYTVNGGNTWVSKDENSFGLPNIPVWCALFNPQNYSQVLIGTELGVWSTDNITAANPNWELSNTGLANTRCEKMVYRNSDGMIAIATFGRGIFMTDVFKKNVPWINLPFDKSFVCKSNVLAINFNHNLNVGSNNLFKVELSLTGDFTDATVIGSGSNSPINVTFPTISNTPSTCKLRVVSTNPNTVSNTSNSFTIGNGATAWLNPTAMVCPNQSLILKPYLSSEEADIEYFQWTGPNGFISSNSSIDISVINSSNIGTYSLTTKFKNGCNNTITSTATISMSTLPTLTVNQTNPTFVIGQPSVLSAEGANRYSWFGPKNWIFENTSSEFTFYPSVGSSGIYRVHGISYNTGCYGSASVNISIKSPCYTTTNLSSPDGDVYTGSTNIQATGMVVGENKVFNNANMQFSSGSEIELKPGFVVQPGAVFKASITGCN